MHCQKQYHAVFLVRDHFIRQPPSEQYGSQANSILTHAQVENEDGREHGREFWSTEHFANDELVFFRNTAKTISDPYKPAY